MCLLSDLSFLNIVSRVPESRVSFEWGRLLCVNLLTNLMTFHEWNPLTLYLSVGVSDAGGIEVEAERGGRGGFSSSPSKHAKNESQHVTKRVCWECVGLSLIYTWIVPLICDSCFFSVDSIEQGGDQALVGLQVQWHQLWEFFKPLWLHTLRCLGKRSRAIFFIKFFSYKEQCLFIHDGGYSSLSLFLSCLSLSGPPSLLFCVVLTAPSTNTF